MGKYEVKLFPSYSEDNLWVRKMPDGSYKIGITDFAQQQLGEVNYIDLPEEGDSITKGEVFGSIESSKAVSDLIAPVSGTVSEVNEEAIDDPAITNRSCYDNGWLIAIEPDNWDAEVAELMSADAYKAFLETQE